MTRMPIADAIYQRFFLGRRDLVLLWIGQVASGFGDSLTFIGFLFLALQLTGSEQAVGFFQTIANIPIIVFGLAAGVYVDRRNRKRVMLVADAGRALALVSIPLLALAGQLTIANAGIAVVAINTLTTFFNPAYNAALPMIVDDPARLFGVNAVMQSSRQFASIAGPAFAAFGAGRNGPVALLAVNSITFLISFTAIAFISTNVAANRRGRIRFEELRREAVIGLRSAMAHRGVRAIFLLTLANNFCLMGPALVGTPLLVKREFHGELGEYALVQLMYALGMTLTGFVLHRRGRVRRLGRLWAIGLLIDGLTLIPYLWARSLAMLCLFTFIHALAIPLIVVSRATIVQRHVPSEVLGRAFGYIDIAVLGVTAISSALVGFAIGAVGARTTIACGGALAAVVGMVALGMRRVRSVVVE